MVGHDGHWLIAHKAHAEKQPALSLSKWPFLAVVGFWKLVATDWLETAVRGDLLACGRLIAVRRDGRWPVTQTEWAEKRPFLAGVCFWWVVIADWLETAVSGGLLASGRLIVIGRDGRWLVVQTAKAEKRPFLAVVRF